MSASLFVDLGVAAILLLFIVSGLRNGFVRSLCSLLALFVAFGGALYLAKHLASPLADLLAPQLLPGIVRRIESDPNDQQQEELSALDLDLLLRERKLPQSWSEMLSALHESAEESEQQSRAPVEQLAFLILRILLAAVIFILAFLLLLVLWRLLSRSLEFLADLPFLSFFNRLLGGALGLVKALLCLFLLRWLLCDLTGLVPEAALVGSYFGKLFGSLYALLPSTSVFLLPKA